MQKSPQASANLKYISKIIISIIDIYIVYSDITYKPPKFTCIC